MVLGESSTSNNRNSIRLVLLNKMYWLINQAKKAMMDKDIRVIEKLNFGDEINLSVVKRIIK
jgi:hypothetical protein